MKWFTVLDQKNTYHHIYLDGENQPLTDFITLLGLYKWIRVPIGLSNAPGEFQWFMENCLFDIKEEYEFSYLDDAMLFSEDLKSHLDHLRIVPQGLEDRSIKINSAKCNFFQKEFNFLDRVMQKVDIK